MQQIDYKISEPTTGDTSSRDKAGGGSLDLKGTQLHYNETRSYRLKADWPDDNAYPVTFTVVYRKFTPAGTLPNGLPITIKSAEKTVTRTVSSGSTVSFSF